MGKQPLPPSKRPTEALRKVLPKDILPQDRADIFLSFVGIALAGASVAFAAHMISDPDRKPEFSGIEYLAIFSRPTHGEYRKPVAVAQKERPGIDYEPVASIRRNTTSDLLDRFDILETGPDGALVRTPENQILRVRAGDILPGAGRVLSVKLLRQRWVVLTEQGRVIQRASQGARP